MEVTNREISDFRDIGGLYVRNVDHEQKNKLWYAVQKMLTRVEKKALKYVEKQNELNRQYAMTEGKDKRLVLNGDKYQYTREAADQLDRALIKLKFEDKVEINPHFVKKDDLPVGENGEVDLSFQYEDPRMGRIVKMPHYDVYRSFVKFVIEPEEEEEEEELEDEPTAKEEQPA